VSYCPECDLPLTWDANGAWIPHTDRQHAEPRGRLIEHADRLMRERTAVLNGHQVTIRFTQTCAWFECTCGARGMVRCDSTYARRDGHDHLDGYRWYLEMRDRDAWIPIAVLCRSRADAEHLLWLRGGTRLTYRIVGPPEEADQ
jgi:hypothetical protein